jgi:glycosyltransferase involved in cell wall biosynthesis
LKIALILPGFSSDERDWCIPAVLDFVRLMAQRAELHVFALRYPHRIDHYPVYGATVHSLNGVGAKGLDSPRLWLRAARALAAEHRRGRFDLLHAFWAYEPGPVAWAGLTLGVPVLASLAGGELARMPHLGYGLQLRPHRRLLIYLALKTARLATASSRYLQALAKSLGFPTVLAPLGVDTDLFSPEPGDGHRPNDGTFRALHVASLMTVKGHDLLLEALALARREASTLRLAFAGADPAALHAALDEQIARLGLADALDFLGVVPHDALPPVYRSADFFVQSSWHEAQGMSVLEAAACGLPVLGTQVGILPDIAPPEWLAPPGDPAALAARLVQATQRPQALRELAQTLRAKVEHDLNLEVCVERFERLYLQATGRT